LNIAWAQYSIAAMNSVYGPSASITVADPYRQPQVKSFMWGFSAGPGNQNAINLSQGNGYTSAYLAMTNPEARIAFYVLYGSYFGDFNKYDDFMRATIATPNSGLGAIWGPANSWAFDSMSLGDTLGSCLVRTANALVNRPRELAIMGDPTLRLAATPAPSNFALSPTQPVLGQSVTLTWTFVSGLTYNVYSSTSPYGPFALVFTDSSAPGTYTENATGTRYIVRALVTTSTPSSGTYVDISIGAMKP